MEVSHVAHVDDTEADTRTSNTIAAAKKLNDAPTADKAAAAGHQKAQTSAHPFCLCLVSHFSIKKSGEGAPERFKPGLAMFLGVDGFADHEVHRGFGE